MEHGKESDDAAPTPSTRQKTETCKCSATGTERKKEQKLSLEIKKEKRACVGYEIEDTTGAYYYDRDPFRTSEEATRKPQVETRSNETKKWWVRPWNPPENFARTRKESKRPSEKLYGEYSSKPYDLPVCYSFLVPWTSALSKKRHLFRSASKKEEKKKATVKFPKSESYAVF